jgi:hypothetical protein
MKRTVFLLVLAWSLSVTAASGQLVRMVEDFEDILPGEDPTRGWTFGVFPGDEGVVPLGNGHVFAAHVDSFGVNLFTKSDGTNPWVGDKDFRADGVVGLGFATRGQADFGNTIRDMSLALINDNGTPSDPSDDFGFIQMSPEDYDFDASQVQKFRWRIPSSHTGSTPNRWSPWDLSGNGNHDFTWDEVVTDVDRIQINYYDPRLFYIFQGHDVVVDNIKLLLDPGAAP